MELWHYFYDFTLDNYNSEFNLFSFGIVEKSVIYLDLRVDNPWWTEPTTNENVQIFDNTMDTWIQLYGNQS